MRRLVRTLNDDEVIIGLSASRNKSIMRWCESFLRTHNILSESSKHDLYFYIVGLLRQDKLSNYLFEVCRRMKRPNLHEVKIKYMQKDENLAMDVKENLRWCLEEGGGIKSYKYLGGDYACSCGYIYSNRREDVPFSTLKTFKCPKCGSDKKSFKEKTVELFEFKLVKFAPLRNL